MKKKILTLLLALVLSVGTCLTVLATDSSTTDNQVNVEWIHENGVNTWKIQSGGLSDVTEYSVELLKDGKSYNSWSSLWSSNLQYDNIKDCISMDFSGTIKESGEYQVKVYPLYENEYGSYTQGECCGISEVATFICPDKTLGTTVGTIGEDKIFRFNAVQGADYYYIKVYLYHEMEGIHDWSEFNMYPDESNPKIVYEVDLNEYIEKIKDTYGEKYGVVTKIQAMSDDINKCLSGEGAMCYPHYVITLTTDDVKESLNEVRTLEEGLTYLDSVTTETLQTAMETDTKVVEKIAEIEKMYVEENEITVSTTVEKDAQSLVDESQISMVGSALNTETEKSTVELVVSVPEKNVDVADTYTNAVQLDISLMINDTAVSELKNPVTISCARPTGVDVKNVVILHYHDNAKTPNVITPTVNADGTISFTVSGFSTFVFANTVASNASNTTTNNSTNTNGTSNIQTAPPTGDTTSIYLIAFTMMVALGTIIVCMKRRTVTKTN